MEKKRKFNCTIEASMCFIGGKYKPLILWHLIEGTKRFSALQRLLPQATPRMLTMNLRELESDGLVTERYTRRCLQRPNTLSRIWERL